MPRDTRCTASATASTAIQQAIAIPTAVMAMILSSSSHGKSTDSTRVVTAAAHSSVLMCAYRAYRIDISLVVMPDGAALIGPTALILAWW